MINDLDKRVTLKKTFVMKSGDALSNMLLQDTIAPCGYIFMVYTNRLINGKPDVVFQLRINIKTTATPDFKALMYLTDTPVLRSGNRPVDVTLSVTVNDYMPVP